MLGDVQLALRRDVAGAWIERYFAQRMAAVVDWGGLPPTEQLLLADAQTSGGLLAAIPPAAAGVFESAFPAAARIGVVTGDGPLRIRP